MKLSPEKQSCLSHKIVDRLWSRKTVDVSSKEILFEVVRHGVQNFAREWDELEQDISKRIQSLKRGVREGSSEWDILYRKAMEEQFQKKSRLFVKK